MAARLTEKEALALGIIGPEDVKGPIVQDKGKKREKQPPTTAFVATLALFIGLGAGFFFGLMF